MTLHLVPVHVDAAKKVGAAVDVEHDPLSCVIVLLARVVIGLHFDPFGFEVLGVGFAPLPPLASSYLPYAIGTELGFEEGGGAVELVSRDVDLVDLDPLWMGHPLGGEGLEFLDGV